MALVASRLNRGYQGSIDPSDVVQSAMGSFFDAARHSRIQVSRSISLWRLLAAFARRKMARAIERQCAIKRGGGQIRKSLESVQPLVACNDGPELDDVAVEFITTLKAELTDDNFVIVEGILAGQTHRELAESLGIDERTIRRRLARVREQLVDVVDLVKDPNTQTGPLSRSVTDMLKLPRVDYSHFVLGKLIGSGGFGKVYRAAMQADGQTIAVKFLRKVFWQNDDARELFLREINLASQIKHPGIIRYLGYGESPHGGPYIVSEWNDGRSLQEVVDVTPKQINHWLRQICDAIGAVHQAGLVHGDLTPSNVLVDKNDRIRITDFGFSQASIDSPTFGLTGQQILGGTPGFAAPEQIAPAFGSISPKTDIYAIGGLLHWLLFRRTPSIGVTLEESLASTLSGNETDGQSREAISSELRRILEVTLRKSPVDRTATVKTVLMLLG